MPDTRWCFVLKLRVECSNKKANRTQFKRSMEVKRHEEPRVRAARWRDDCCTAAMLPPLHRALNHQRGPRPKNAFKTLRELTRFTPETSAAGRRNTRMITSSDLSIIRSRASARERTSPCGEVFNRSSLMANRRRPVLLAHTQPHGVLTRSGEKPPTQPSSGAFIVSLNVLLLHIYRYLKKTLMNSTIFAAKISRTRNSG